VIIARTTTELAPFHRGVLIPTMGALHEGHTALIRAAVEARESSGGAVGSVVVSVFVNPAQFDEQTDYDNYPNTLDEDARACEALGADCVFNPTPDTVYPGFPDSPLLTTPITLPEACRDKGLEDEYRPGHFEGVFRVCHRLFELCDPAHACFGEKDWQQLQLARHLTQTDFPRTTIIPVPTVREPEGSLFEGLALSSRNVHLTEADAPAARSLSRAIRLAQETFAKAGDYAESERAARAHIQSTTARIEYLDIRDAETCGPPTDPASARVLTAARVGKTRLIDNDALVP